MNWQFCCFWRKLHVLYLPGCWQFLLLMWLSVDSLCCIDMISMWFVCTFLATVLVYACMHFLIWLTSHDSFMYIEDGQKPAQVPPTRDTGSAADREMTDKIARCFHCLHYMCVLFGFGETHVAHSHLFASVELQQPCIVHRTDHWYWTLFWVQKEKLLDNTKSY